MRRRSNIVLTAILLAAFACVLALGSAQPADLIRDGAPTRRVSVAPDAPGDDRDAGGVSSQTEGTAVTDAPDTSSTTSTGAEGVSGVTQAKDAASRETAMPAAGSVTRTVEKPAPGTVESAGGSGAVPAMSEGAVEHSAEGVDNAPAVGAPVPAADEPAPQAPSEPVVPKTHRFFALPEGADFAPRVALMSVDENADVADVESLLAVTPGIAAQSVSEDDIRQGMLVVTLEEGVEVEDAVNALLSSGSKVVEGAQPDYAYQVAEAQGPADLIEQLDLNVEDDIVVVEETEAPSADGAEAHTGDGVEEVPDIVVEDPAAVGYEEPQPQEVEEAIVEERVEEGGDTQADESEVEPTRELLLQLATYTPNDYDADKQWGLRSARLPEAWALARSDGAIAIAVIDNGVYVDHEDLAANIIPGSAYNAAHDYNHRDIHDVTPVSYHGSHVAGTVGAVANNGVGVVGSSYNAKIVPIQVFDDSGNAYTSNVVDAYKYLKEHRDEWNIRVANMSLGMKTSKDDFTDDEMVKAIQEATDECGIITVGAACNESGTAKVPYYAYPGDSESIISVMNLTGTASSTGNDASGAYHVERSTMSNYNLAGQGGPSTMRGKNIAAPGTSILSTNSVQGSYVKKSGTSMASPLVAGIIALELAANPGIDVAGAEGILYATAKDLGTAGWDETYGYGEVDAFEAVQAALGTGFVTFVEGKGIVSGTLSGIEGLTYDGKAKEPTVVLTAGGKALVRGTDYTVSYRDNVNAGAATVTVVGKGDYAAIGTRTLHFTIDRAQIGSADVALSPQGFTYGRAPWHALSDDDGVFWHVPAITCSLSGSVLAGPSTLTATGRSIAEGTGTDYSVRVTGFASSGTAKVTLTGRGNCKGTKTVSYEITPASIGAVDIVLSQQTLAFTGKEVEPSVSVAMRDADGVAHAMPATSYRVSYANNILPGVAQVNVTGLGDLTGVASLSFTITGTVPLSDASIVASPQTCTYTGGAQTPTAVVSYGSVTLVEGSDYTVDYRDNVSAGTATIIVRGRGRCSGTVEVPFEIAPAALTSIALEETSVPFDGGSHKPKVSSAVAGELVLAEGDYQVTYLRGTSSTTDFTSAGTITVRVEGTGSFSGVKTASFDIVAYGDFEVAALPDIIWQQGTVVNPTVVVRSGDKSLVEGRDYTVSVSGNEGPGTATVTVTGMGGYSGVRQVHFDILYPVSMLDMTITPGYTYGNGALEPRPSVSCDGQTLLEGVDYRLIYTDNVMPGNASVTVEGMGTYAGSRTLSFAIACPLSRVSVTALGPMVATGSPLTPRPIVMLDGIELIEGVDYTLIYHDNTVPGVAKVTLLGTGFFVGQRTVTFTIMEP